MNPLLEDSGLRTTAFYDKRKADVPIDFNDRRRRGIPLIAHRLWEFIAYSDTTPTKGLLALTATFWAALLLLPGDSLNRPVYFYLALVAGDHPDEKWAAAWLLYALPMWWRVFSAPRRHVWFAMVLNIYGLGLFATIPVCFFMQRLYPFPVGSGPYVALALAAAWVLVRTNNNPFRGWRGD